MSVNSEFESVVDGDVFISEEKKQELLVRGYNEDVLPKTKENRNMSAKNYFTLWMG